MTEYIPLFMLSFQFIWLLILLVYYDHQRKLPKEFFVVQTGIDRWKILIQQGKKEWYHKVYSDSLFDIEPCFEDCVYKSEDEAIIVASSLSGKNRKKVE